MFGIFGMMLGTLGEAFRSIKSRFSRSKSGKAHHHSQAAWAFGNITRAHCDPEDIVDEFGMDTEFWEYPDPVLGDTPWNKAYNEALEDVMLIAMLTMEDPEDLIDWEEVEEAAFDYAVEWAERLMSGKEWIPDEDMLEWAFYDVSDHNY